MTCKPVTMIERCARKTYDILVYKNKQAIYIISAIEQQTNYDHKAAT